MDWRRQGVTLTGRGGVGRSRRRLLRPSEALGGPGSRGEDGSCLGREIWDANGKVGEEVEIVPDVFFSRYTRTWVFPAIFSSEGSYEGRSNHHDVRFSFNSRDL